MLQEAPVSYQTHVVKSTSPILCVVEASDQTAARLKSLCCIVVFDSCELNLLQNRTVKEELESSAHIKITI